MSGCAECKTYKKASNCMECYREQKRQYLSLCADLRHILASTSYYMVSEKVRERLQKDGEG